jgi:ubiquinone/menaquinone biosynthesis C-methylase UbiE
VKEWWQKIFIPVIGEVMFGPRVAQGGDEVEQIIKQVKVPPSADVLDLACGIGRHSIPFAKKKFRVTGLDFSANFLEQARKTAKKEKVNVKFVHGDMKNLKPHFSEAQFDLVVSLFNSFGYFKVRSNDRKMLKEIFRVLKPGGYLVINTLNGDGVKLAMKNPISNGREPVKNVFVIDAAKYDVEKKKTFANWTIIDARKPKARVHRLSFDQNVYTHKEMKRLLTEAGFKIEKTWGLLHGTSFDEKSTWHQTVVARKPIR